MSLTASGEAAGIGGQARPAGLDPRTRVLAAISLVIAIVSLQGPAMLAVALAGALGLALLSELPLAGLARRLLHIEGFMLVLLVLLPLTTPGTLLFTVGPLAASTEGLMLALILILRIAACVTVVFALLGGLEPVRLAAALAGLSVPVRLVHLLLFVIRYIAIFRDEARRLTAAMRARAFAGRAGLHSLRSYGNLAGMLMVRALDRAERVDEAMRCRGFDGRFPLPAVGCWGRSDALFGSGVAMAAALLLAADRLA